MIETIVSMREALAHSDYFGSQLGSPSWANWRVLLIAIAGEPLLEEELPLFEALTNRKAPPAAAPHEFFGCIGRRGGKSRAMAVLACWLSSCRDHRQVAAPGERPQLPVLAQTRDQAPNVFNFICGAFASAPALRPLVEGRNSDTLWLGSGVDITVRPSSFRSTRGATLIGAICDEIAWWRDETSALPDVEILRALRPGLLTTRGPLIAISSPYARKGELWKAYSKHWGREGSRTLVAQASSQIMNPGLDAQFIAEKYEEDSVAAAAEYGAAFQGGRPGVCPARCCR